MCAIVGSFDREKLLELAKLNSYRGSHSFSFSTINIETGELEVRSRGIGELVTRYVQFSKNEYAIVHIQAPTTEAKAAANIHPAVEHSTDKFNSAHLWHNGIIKANHVKVLQSKFGIDTNWDTQLLLRAVCTSWKELNTVDGSFSCLLHDHNTSYLFRNSISPMFYDGELNISSTKFLGSIATPPNKVLKMDFGARCLYTVDEFKTVENPYFFGDEI